MSAALRRRDQGGRDPAAGARLRGAVNGFVARHETAWELLMGALAIAFVVLGELIDRQLVPEFAVPANRPRRADRASP